MTNSQKKYTVFLESVCNKFNCPEALPALKEGFRAFCEADSTSTVNHEGKWSPSTTRAILANTPVCPDCNGEGVTSSCVTCKTCGGVGHIMSDKLRRLYSRLSEKEYYEEEELRDAERVTDYSNEDLHMWA